jgi:plastocyanin domain-containing protein
MRALLLTATLFAAACGNENAAQAPAEGPVRHEITVDQDGYHPASVEARSGEPVTLVFRRTSEEGCGEELVIAEHGIRRDLPVGEPVEVTFTPTRVGSVSFTCGMNMYRGAVVVR